MRRILLPLLCFMAYAAAPMRAANRPTTRPIVLCPYYTWYTIGPFWSHWTYPQVPRDPNPLAHPGDPPLASAAYPLAGLYASDDRAIADWHIRLAKQAGIDAFLVSWWGPDSRATKDFERALLPAAQAQSFKIALLDELAQYHTDDQAHAHLLAAALKKYTATNAYLKLDGRPVVYLYQVAQHPGLTPASFATTRTIVEAAVGPVYWIVDKLAHDPAATNPAHLKQIPADWLATPGIDAFAFYGTYSHFREYHYADLAPRYQYLVESAHQAHHKMFLPVHPGFDNARFSPTPLTLPRDNGDTLRAYLRAAADAHPDGILLTSWNEWPETTAIEPSSTWPDPYLYLKILANWTGHAATTFPPSPTPTDHAPPNR